MILAGRINDGGVVSITVIVCIAVDTLPQASLALHVRLIIFVPPQLLLTESVKLTVVALQPSVTMGTPVALVVVGAGHSKVKSDGATIVGGVVSRIVINWIPLVVLPQASVALHSREINFEPPQILLMLSLNVTVTLPQPSWAVAVPVLRMFVLAGHSKVRFTGSVNVGGVESRTVIVWIAFVTLPQRSRAEIGRAHV